MVTTLLRAGSVSDGAFRRLLGENGSALVEVIPFVRPGAMLALHWSLADNRRQGAGRLIVEGEDRKSEPSNRDVVIVPASPTCQPKTPRLGTFSQAAAGVVYGADTLPGHAAHIARSNGLQ